MKRKRRHQKVHQFYAEQEAPNLTEPESCVTSAVSHERQSVSRLLNVGLQHSDKTRQVSSGHLKL